MEDSVSSQNDSDQKDELLSLGILHTSSEKTFDEIAKLASLICHTPIALISFFDAKNEWVKSKIGTAVSEIPREFSIFQPLVGQTHVVEENGVNTDPRYARNPLMMQPQPITFYAAAPLISLQGNIIGAISVANPQPQQLTQEQKAALQSLAQLVINQLELHLQNNQKKESIKKLEDITFALNESAILAITDRTGKITLVNQKFVDLSGYSQAELLGKDHRILNSNYHPKSFFINLWKTILSGKTWRGEIRNRNKKGGIYWVETTIVPIYGTDNKIEQLVSIRFDITQRKLAEQQLMHSSKMSLLGTLAGGLAHEINNPLMIIRGKTEYMTRLIDAPSQDFSSLRPHLNKIQDMVSRIASVVNGLKIFARKEDRSLVEGIIIKNLIEQILALFEGQALKNGIKIWASEINPDLVAYGRFSDLVQVMMNLLTNAIDAVENSEAKWVSIDVTERGNLMEIAITDSGQGIPHEIQSKIMEPFFSTKAIGKGVGLGLSLAAKIIEEHRGALLLDNQSSHTRFVIQLPKTFASSQDPAA